MQEPEEPREMTDAELVRCLEFLDYFNVDCDDDSIVLTDGNNSCIMNPNTQFKEFLGCSINSISQAVARKLNKPTVWERSEFDYDEEQEEEEE